jgi:hypothetical protein
LALSATGIGLAGRAAAADSDAAEQEIEFLLTSVGSSECVFERNGTRHSASEAESHLRLKYGKAHRHIDDAEQFIVKLASQSSWTGETYTIDCPGAVPQPSRDWLTARLQAYRGDQATQ